MQTTLDQLLKDAPAFGKKLDDIRGSVKHDFEWYAYSSMNNMQHLDQLLEGQYRNITELAGGKPVADIGAADGDMSFFLEKLGLKMHIIDHASTNINHLEGAKLLKKELKSNVEIHDVDLDAQFTLPHDDYGLVIFLGILYHLKNPFYALEYLSKVTRYCLVSTRVMRFTPGKKHDIDDMSLAYLVGEHELNDDPTNFWVFSNTGLKRLFDRTGWKIRGYKSLGDTESSTPDDMKHDERAFALLESTRK